ncbi:MAG: hypothetical protein FJ358_07840 [Thaumarchaeota archaeon]|nr:hypothetical protein [Nitrososphaerota archaeon]
MRLSKQMLKILLAIKSNNGIRLADIIMKCEGLPQYYYNIFHKYDEVWVSKCPNLETAIAATEANFDGVALVSGDRQTLSGVDLGKTISRLWASYCRSALTLIRRWRLIERLCNENGILTKKYVITSKGVEVLNVKCGLPQMPKPQRPCLKPFCPSCMDSNERRITWLEPRNREGWFCSICGFKLPLTNFANIPGEIFQSLSDSISN